MKKAVHNSQDLEPVAACGCGGFAAKSSKISGDVQVVCHRMSQSDFNFDL